MDDTKIEPRPYNDPKAEINIDGFWYARDEAEQVHRQNDARRAAHQKKAREQWMQTPQGKLCMAFYDAFQAYRAYLKEHPNAINRADGPRVNFEEHKLFEEGLRLVDDHRRERNEKLRLNLEKAQKAARCQHHYMSGEQCGAPRMKNNTLCRMHDRLEEAKAVRLDLGPMEDPDSIQVAIKKLQGAIIDGKLDHRQVGQLAYTIQLAAWNVMRTTTGVREMEETG
jgi:hypothetical protein